MSNYDQNPRSGSKRPSSSGRPSGGQRSSSSRSDMQSRGEYPYPPRRQSAHGRRRRRNSGPAFFAVALLSLLAGVVLGVWLTVNFNIDKLFLGSLSPEPSVRLSALPTDDWNGAAEDDSLPSEEPFATEEAAMTQEPYDSSDVIVPLYDEENTPDGGEFTDVPPEFTAEPIQQATVEPASQEKVYTSYKKGDTDEEIKNIQEKLIEQGFLDDTADGMFGSRTEAAIKAYQNSVGLGESGIADEETQKKLFPEESPPADVQEEPATVENISLSLGEQGVIADYVALQFALYDFGYEVFPSVMSDDVIPTFLQTETDGMTFLYLDGTIENLSDQAINAKRINFSIYTGSVNEYAGYIAFERDDGTSLKGEVDLEPGEKTRVVMHVEVPVELSQSDEPIVALVSVKDTVYHITLR